MLYEHELNGFSGGEAHAAPNGWVVNGGYRGGWVEQDENKPFPAAQCDIPPMQPIPIVVALVFLFHWYGFTNHHAGAQKIFSYGNQLLNSM